MSTNGLNPRQRKFVDNLAKGMSGKQAYLAAGYKGVGNGAEAGAVQLIRNKKVTASLEDTRKRNAERSAVTVENLTSDFYELRDLAIHLGQVAPAVAALGMIAKLHGLLIDKVQADVSMALIPKPSIKPTTEVLLSPEEWIRNFAPPRIANGHGPVSNGHDHVGNGAGENKMNGSTENSHADDARPVDGESVYD